MLVVVVYDCQRLNCCCLLLVVVGCWFAGCFLFFVFSDSNDGWLLGVGCFHVIYSTGSCCRCSCCCCCHCCRCCQLLLLLPSLLSLFYFVDHSNKKAITTAITTAILFNKTLLKTLLGHPFASRRRSDNSNVVAAVVVAVVAAAVVVVAPFALAVVAVDGS